MALAVAASETFRSRPPVLSMGVRGPMYLLIVIDAVAPAFEIFNRYIQRVHENVELAEKLVISTLKAAVLREHLGIGSARALQHVKGMVRALNNM